MTDREIECIREAAERLTETGYDELAEHLLAILAPALPAADCVEVRIAVAVRDVDGTCQQWAFGITDSATLREARRRTESTS
jgi:hypothetical protein